MGTGGGDAFQLKRCLSSNTDIVCLSPFADIAQKSPNGYNSSMRVRTPVDFGLMIRRARRSRGMTQQQLAHAAAVGRQWIVEIEAGKPRAELGRVLRTLAALDLSLTLHGEGIPEVRQSGKPIETIDLQAILDAHRRTSP